MLIYAGTKVTPSINLYKLAPVWFCIIYSVDFLQLPQAQQLCCTASLCLPAHSMTAAVLTEMTKETHCTCPNRANYITHIRPLYPFKFYQHTQ